MNTRNILIFGAGAVGTYIGGSLAANGNHVTFIEQERSIPDLEKNGLHLDLRKTRKKLNDSISLVTISPDSFKCISSVRDSIAYGPFDFGIYTLKSFDTATAIEAIKPNRENLPPFLCLSNGVENEPSLSSALGEDKVIAGTVTSSISKIGAGNVVLERERGIGLFEGHPLSLEISETLIHAGLRVKLYKNAAGMKWSKLLTNILVNATAAILGMEPGEILSIPGLHSLEMGMLKEAIEVMKAQNIPVVDTPYTPVKLLTWAASLPTSLSRLIMKKAIGGGRGRKMPSFYLDLHSGRGKSEVVWLNGAVVRYGEKYGVPTPINKSLTEILLSLSSGMISLDTYLHRPEKLIAAINEI